MNWKLIYSIFKMIVRDRQALYFSLVFPVVTMLILKLVLGQTVLASGVNYIDFVVPGLVTMSLMQMAVFSIAFVVAQHKEKGVIRRLLATPMRSSDFLIAQVSSRVVVAVLQVLLLVSVSILALSFTVKGSFLGLVVLAILGSLVFLSLGFIISGLSRTVETVPALANLIIFPMIIFGDIFFSLDKSPLWLQKVAERLPVQYLVDGFRGIMIQGKTLFDVRYDVLGLLVWLVVFFLIAQRVFSLGAKR